jgi:hypothetical protein
MSTLNDLIISAISGAEADEGLAPNNPTPEVEKTAGAEVVAEDVDVEKIASALEWYGNTGINAFVELDKKASPDLDKIRTLLDSDLSLTQAVATAHPLMSSSDRAEIVETLSAEKTAGEEEEVKTAAEGAPKSSGSNEPDTDEDELVSGEQADASDADADHHPALASNEKAMGYAKSEKSKHQSKSLSRILDSKPFADPALSKALDAAKGGTDPNIHAKTASDKDVVLSQVKEALATKLAERVSEAN